MVLSLCNTVAQTNTTTKLRSSFVRKQKISFQRVLERILDQTAGRRKPRPRPNKCFVFGRAPPKPTASPLCSLGEVGQVQFHEKCRGRSLSLPSTKSKGRKAGRLGLRGVRRVRSQTTASARLHLSGRGGCSAFAAAVYHSER